MIGNNKMAGLAIDTELKGNTSGLKGTKVETNKPQQKQNKRDKRQENLEDRTTLREAKRSRRIDARELRRKTRFDARDANKGKTYQEKRGTDVGNFFRRFSNPAASQNPPTNGGNTGATNYDDKKQEENIKLNTNWNIGGSTEDYLNSQSYKTPGYMGGNLDHTTVSLQNNKNKND